MRGAAEHRPSPVVKALRGSGTTWSELDRVVEGCGTATTRVWFALREDLGDAAADTSYWLYLDHPAAGPAPADPGAVHLAHDDFEAQPVGRAPGGWTITGDATWSVIEADGRRVLRGEATPEPGRGRTAAASTSRLTLDGLDERDVLVTARVRATLGNDVALCAVARVGGDDHLDGCVARQGAERSLQLRRTRDGGSTVLADGATTWDDAAWHRLGLGAVGDHLRLERDGASALETDGPGLAAAGGAGLWAQLRNEPVEVDEVVVRRLARVEPDVEVGAAELRPS